LIDILFALTISIFSGDTEQFEQIDIYWTNGSYRFCSSIISCYLPEEGEIWINMKYLDRKDKTCERDPWTHEVLHVIYGGSKVVHGNCDLKIYKGMIAPFWYG